MSTFQPPVNVFQQIQDSRAALTHGTSDAGNTVTSANGAKGAWAAIGPVLAEDCYGLEIMVRRVTPIVNQDNNWMCDIGVDPAGGTSYNVRISNLIFEGLEDEGSVGDPFDLGFFFPLFIKVGASIAARAQVKGATGSTFALAWRAYQKPSRPELWKTGSFVDSVGVNTTACSGTTLTQGTPDSTTYGAWTSLGTAPRDAWWIQPSAATPAGAVDNRSAVIEYGVGNQPSPGNIQVLMGFNLTTTGDSHTYYPANPFSCFIHCPAGTPIYARYKTQAFTAGPVGAAVYLMG